MEHGTGRATGASERLTCEDGRAYTAERRPRGASERLTCEDGRVYTAERRPCRRSSSTFAAS